MVTWLGAGVAVMKLNLPAAPVAGQVLNLALAEKIPSYPAMLSRGPGPLHMHSARNLLIALEVLHLDFQVHHALTGMLADCVRSAAQREQSSMLKMQHLDRAAAEKHQHESSIQGSMLPTSWIPCSAVHEAKVSSENYGLSPGLLT